MESYSGGSLSITCTIATSLLYIVLNLNLLKYTRIQLYLRTLINLNDNETQYAARNSGYIVIYLNDNAAI